MFNVNPFEAVVIAVLFLVLFGPERIPEMAMKAGKMYRDLRQAADAASSEFTREIEVAARLGAEDEARQKADERKARLGAEEEAPHKTEESQAPPAGDAAALGNLGEGEEAARTIGKSAPSSTPNVDAEPAADAPPDGQDVPMLDEDAPMLDKADTV